MSSTIYQRIEDMDRYTQRLEDIANFVDSFLDVNEKLSSDEASVPLIPIKEYLKTAFPIKFDLVDDDCSFGEPPPPYSITDSGELLSTCLYPEDKHDRSDRAIDSLPKSRSQKRRRNFRECFVFWKAAEFGGVAESDVNGGSTNKKEPMPPDYSYEYKNTVAESHGAFDPELKEAPKLESASTKEGPDTPTARQLTIEQKEELMEFFCYSAYQPGMRSPEVKHRIGTVFRYIKLFGEYMDSINCLCDSVGDTMEIYRSRVASWNKRINRSRPLGRRRQWGR